MSLVTKPVNGCCRQHMVRKNSTPLAEIQVGSEHYSPALIAFRDQIVKVLIGRALKWLQAEVVQNKEVWSKQAGELALVSPIGTGCPELTHQLVKRAREHVETAQAGFVADRFSQVRLADSGRPDDQRIDLLVDEEAGRQVEDLRLVNLGVWGATEQKTDLRALRPPQDSGDGGRVNVEQPGRIGSGLLA